MQHSAVAYAYVSQHVSLCAVISVYLLDGALTNTYLM